MAAIEGKDREEIEGTPPEIDPEEGAEEADGVGVELRKNGEVAELSLDPGKGEEGSEVETCGESEENGQAQGSEEEESKAGEGAGPGHEEAFAGRELGVRSGEPAEGHEFDVGGDAGEFAAGESVSQFVDENGDENGGDGEEGGDEAVPALDGEAASDDKGPEPKEGLNPHRDVEDGEVEHGERIAGARSLARRVRIAASVGIW